LFATESSPVQKTEKLAIAEDSKNLLYLVDSKFWRREGEYRPPLIPHWFIS